ncbi:MAG: hypothetical protein H8E21_03670 [Gammaproteobacteria bacterium]|nr:hypothetical protein [Gammaproteobacteria bacterium]MBL6999287.1 hypothetical protein [Gammaproteobacteria bacterium]
MKSFPIQHLFLLGILSAATGSLFAVPPPGHPSTDESLDMLKLPETTHLPYQGQVLEAINSNGYTYIQVQIEMGHKKLWLAAPRVELKKGQFIRFPSGTLIKNFYSRLLQRTFDGVIFVRTIDILPEQA